MKWTASLTYIRHGQTAYNGLEKWKVSDPTYRKFKTLFDTDPSNPTVLELAQRLREQMLNENDYSTELTPLGEKQAYHTALALKNEMPLPDAIFYSPYLRTEQTLIIMCEAWGALKKAVALPDDRIREQEHGLASLYGDRRIFQTFHPEQRKYWNQLGDLVEYYYRYPQGESVLDVRTRGRLFNSMLIREYAERHVLVITHHLTILTSRDLIERLTPKEFIRIDKEEKPINCGVTRYRVRPDLGKDGRLELEYYNKHFYPEALYE